jgi:hypothetical protein
MLEKAASGDTRSTQFACQAEFSANVEVLRQTKVLQQNAEAQAQERRNVRERIREDDIAQLWTELEHIEKGISEMEKQHKTACDEALDKLVQCALALKKAMSRAG